MLLFLILALIILFSWFSTYQENKIKAVGKEYNKKLEEMTGKSVLEQSNKTMLLKEAKETLEEAYSGLKNQNDDLRRENDELQSEVNSIKSGLEEQKSKFEKLSLQFQQVQNALINANEQISSLIYRNKELCRKLEEKGEKC